VRDGSEVAANHERARPLSDEVLFGRLPALLTVIYSARTIRSSSYQMEPETNCSDGDRASRASRTYCARHSAFGIEKENSNSFRESDDHWAFPYRDRCRTGACDAPPQAAPAGNIAPILALELVSARRQHGDLRCAREIHASVPELDEEGALGVAVGSSSNGCRDTRSRGNDPIEWKPGGSNFKVAIEQQADVSELLSRQ
jgi:hypothetical protein